MNNIDNIVIASCRMIIVTSVVAGALFMTACRNTLMCSDFITPYNVVDAQRNGAAQLGIPAETTLPKSGIVLRFIPAGTFFMGSHKRESKRGDDEARHKVTLTKPFYIGKYEVTQGQWKKVVGNNPSCFTNAGYDAPVDTVSWDDCTNFMVKLAKYEGMPAGSFRLPTEAEWEYACRAGTQSAFCYGDNMDWTMANVNGLYPYGNGRRGILRNTTVAVGQFQPNAWGIYDMHGNVEEWCANVPYSYKADETDPNPQDGSQPTDKLRDQLIADPNQDGSEYATRGGAWDVGSHFSRSATRTCAPYDFSKDNIGFRLVMRVKGH